MPETADNYALWMPIAEVLAIIAFGRADGFVDDAPARLAHQWGDSVLFDIDANPEGHPLVLAIKGLLARERWWLSRKSTPCPLPLASGLRAELRLGWHRHNRRPFRDLLPVLLTDLAAYPKMLAKRDAIWAEATKTF
jgi:hypothetical protein